MNESVRNEAENRFVARDHRRKPQAVTPVTTRCAKPGRSKERRHPDWGAKCKVEGHGVRFPPRDRLPMKAVKEPALPLHSPPFPPVAEKLHFRRSYS